VDWCTGCFWYWLLVYHYTRRIINVKYLSRPSGSVASSDVYLHYWPCALQQHNSRLEAIMFFASWLFHYRICTQTAVALTTVYELHSSQRGPPWRRRQWVTVPASQARPCGNARVAAAGLCDRSATLTLACVVFMSAPSTVNQWPHNAAMQLGIWQWMLQKFDQTLPYTAYERCQGGPLQDHIDYLLQLSYGGTVILHVCLLACLSVVSYAGYLKMLLTDLNQILWNDRSSAKDQSTRWDWSGSESIQDQFFHFSIINR